MSELKPCPFCGGEARIMLEEEDRPDDSFHNVYCTGCGAQFWVKSKSEAEQKWNRRAQPDEPLNDIGELLESTAQDMDDKCRQWQCVLQRVHDAGTFDQNSGLWVGIDKEREAKAQASFETYRYALGAIDKIAELVSNSYKSAHKPGGEQDA